MAANTPPAHPLRGVALLLASLFFFATMDATAKHLAQTYSIPLLVWVRYLVHCLLMATLLGPRHGWRLVATRRPGLQVARGLMLVGCTVFVVAALARMPLAETMAVIFTAPLLVAILAGPWLGERLTGGRWLAVMAGFAGVLLIARPGTAVTFDGLACALIAAVCNACYQLFTRQLAGSESTTTLVFYTALVGTLAMSLGLPWFWRELPGIPLADAAAIASLGALGGIGHFLLTRAFRHAPASLLSPLTYVQLIWATLLGALVFSEWPDALSALGMVVIVGGGLGVVLTARPGHLRPAAADRDRVG